MAQRWVADHREALTQADPHVPATPHDRAADNWRPLTERQAMYLALLIGYRKGSGVFCRESDGAVIGYTAAAGDGQDFLKHYPHVSAVEAVP
jgi:hypothetical protein